MNSHRNNRMSRVGKLRHAFVDLNRSRRSMDMDMSIIRERMEELGVDLATLNRRYCEVRRNKGDTSATPVNRRNMLAKAISDEGNPTLETFMDIIAALDGKVLIEWKSTKIKEFGGDSAA
jgi:DNA-binding phage protein